MTDFIGDELPPKVIRVTRGADRTFTLRRKDTGGLPVPWPASVYVNIDTKEAPTRITAVVTGNLAVIRIESTVVDKVTNRTTWQAIMSEAGTPTLETALMVGTFQVQNGNA